MDKTPLQWRPLTSTQEHVLATGQAHRPVWCRQCKAHEESVGIELLLARQREGITLLGVLQQHLQGMGGKGVKRKVKRVLVTLLPVPSTGLTISDRASGWVRLGGHPGVLGKRTAPWGSIGVSGEQLIWGLMTKACQKLKNNVRDAYQLEEAAAAARLLSHAIHTPCCWCQNRPMVHAPCTATSEQAHTTVCRLQQPAEQVVKGNNIEITTAELA